MYTALVSPQNLWLVDKRMTEPRAALLRAYLTDYLEPALKAFPEMIGRVHLSMSRLGFVFRERPSYQIDVSEAALQSHSPQELHAVTAYMLAYFTLHWRGYELLGTVFTEKEKDRRAVLLAFSRGYAPDILHSLLHSCRKHPCDAKHKLWGVFCAELFPHTCKEALSLSAYADALTACAAQCDFGAPIDYAQVFQRARAQAS
ncbi:MAG: hypothetical protein PHI98_12200 [Eubacteriales bacterium]|nr:hypothetical protein [Eubacteriales bacterium]